MAPVRDDSFGAGEEDFRYWVWDNELWTFSIPRARVIFA